MGKRSLWRGLAIVLLVGPFLLAVLPALIVPVVIYGMCHVPKTAAGFKEVISNHKIVSILLLITGSFVVIFVILFILEKINTSAQKKAELHFIVQILSGNWSTPPYLVPVQGGSSVVDPYALLKLCASASFALVLNLATLGLGGLALRYISVLRKEYRMNPRALYAARDTAIRAAFEELVRDAPGFNPEQKKEAERLLRQAINSGDKTWYNEYLDDLYKSEAPQVRKNLVTHDI